MDSNNKSASRLSKSKEKSFESSASTRERSNSERGKVSEAVMKRQMDKLQKRMEAFDNNYEMDSVTTKNFKR